jgi:hypothetical protein
MEKLKLKDKTVLRSLGLGGFSVVVPREWWT